MPPTYPPFAACHEYVSKSDFCRRTGTARRSLYRPIELGWFAAALDSSGRVDLWHPLAAWFRGNGGRLPPDALASLPRDWWEATTPEAVEAALASGKPAPPLPFGPPIAPRTSRSSTPPEPPRRNREAPQASPRRRYGDDLDEAPQGRPEPLADDLVRYRTAAVGVPVEDVLDWTLSKIVAVYGGAEPFKTHLDAVKKIEEIRERRQKTSIRGGDLVSRALVKVHLFGYLDALSQRLLVDAPRSIAVRARHAPSPEEAEAIIREEISKTLQATKAQITAAIKGQSFQKPEEEEEK